MLNQIKDFIYKNAPTYFYALATLIIGWILIGLFTSIVRRMMETRKVDGTLIPFISSLMNAILKVALVISVASMIGIKTTSFVAVLGAAGLAIGLALQGSLSNFAGGVLILLFRPFKSGDFIEASGHSGTVKEIQIFSTILTTGDNKTIILPNGPLANGPIVNTSTQERRRVDLVFGISYEDDFEKAKAIISEHLEKDERVLSDPAYFVRVTALADNSVNITVRAWTDKGNYWPLTWDLLESVKKSFDSEGISFPFPQRDVTLYPSDQFSQIMGPKS